MVESRPRSQKAVRAGSFGLMSGVAARCRLGPLLIAGAVALGGCGNLTAGGAAEVEVVVAADEGGSVLTWAAPMDPGASGVPPEELLTGFEGTLTLAFSLALVAGDDEVSLTDGEITVSLPIGEGVRTEVARIEVPAGEYDGYRAVFSRVDADITASPGQAPFPDRVEVDLEEGSLVVQHPAPVVLGTDDAIRVVLDLRTGVWIIAAAPSDGKVLRGIFRNALRIVVESP
jgi:hypothetical protein